MRKKVLIIFSLILIACLGILTYLNSLKKSFGINPDKLPKVVTETDLSKFSCDSLERLWGFSGQNLEKKDFSNISLGSMPGFSFDEETKWPEADKLPKGFVPKEWLEVGKYPGLNISQLHKKGITGKGVSIAVFDKPILWTHNEFKDRIVYKTIDEDKRLHFHGISCTSYLAGKSCGVAPEAKIYYFAVPDKCKNFYYYSLAMDELIKTNKKLPKNQKIKIVSISDGIGEEDKNYEKWQEALKKAKEEGITVIYSNVLEDFIWGGCVPFKDKNDFSNYVLSDYFDDIKQDPNIKSKIIIPSDFRTAASNKGNDKYAYWSEGGFSSAIPYIVGLSTLAWQVHPELTFDEIIDYIKETKTVTEDGCSIINPVTFINEISNSKQQA